MGRWIYSVMSYTVTAQMHDIGIRVARGEVAIGLVASMGMARVLANLFCGVSATDPVTFVGTTFVLMASGIVAIYIPARQAAKVDPLVALRYE